MDNPYHYNVKLEKFLSTWVLSSFNLLVIPLNLFSSSRNPLQSTTSDNFKKYLIVCTILPLILAVIFSMNLNLSLLISILMQRRYPQSTFGYYTKQYMTWVGLFEMIVKAVTFSFFLGAFILIKKQEKILQNMNVQMNKPKLTICGR